MPDKIVRMPAAEELELDECIQLLDAVIGRVSPKINTLDAAFKADIEFASTQWSRQDVDDLKTLLLAAMDLLQNACELRSMEENEQTCKRGEK